MKHSFDQWFEDNKILQAEEYETEYEKNAARSAWNAALNYAAENAEVDWVENDKTGNTDYYVNKESILKRKNIMPYILKNKKTGEYVGNKGFRSWASTPTQDKNKARIFRSMAGIKNWFGQFLPKDIQERNRKIWNEEYSPKMRILNNTVPFDYYKVKAFHKEYNDKYIKPFLIPVTDHYEIIELDLNKQ